MADTTAVSTHVAGRLSSLLGTEHSFWRTRGIF